MAPACSRCLCVSCEEAGPGLETSDPTHRSGTGRRATVGTMSETEPTAEQPVPQPTGPAARLRRRGTRLRDRVFGLRSVVAVALAGVVLGGLGGFGIHAATDGDGRDGRMGRFGPGGGFQDGPGGRGGPGGFPQGPGQGQGPGGQAPQVPQPSQSPGQDS